MPRKFRATCRNRITRLEEAILRCSRSRFHHPSTSPTAAWTPQDSAIHHSTEVHRKTTTWRRCVKTSSRNPRENSAAIQTSTGHLRQPPAQVYSKPKGKFRFDELFMQSIFSFFPCVVFFPNEIENEFFLKSRLKAKGKFRCKINQVWLKHFSLAGKFDVCGLTRTTIKLVLNQMKLKKLGVFLWYFLKMFSGGHKKL